LLFQPNGLQLNALFGWAGIAGCGSAQRTRFVVSFRRTNGDVQQHERNGRDKAWSKARAGGLLCSVSSATSCLIAPTTPSLHYSIPHEIPRNLSRRFPLYGVEASGLPAKAIERNGLNVKQDHRTSETQLHSRKERMERSADIPVRQPRSPAAGRVGRQGCRLGGNERGGQECPRSLGCGCAPRLVSPAHREHRGLRNLWSANLESISEALSMRPGRKKQ